MLKYKFLVLAIYFKSLFCPCGQDNHTNGSRSIRSEVKVSRLVNLDTAIKECSGFALMTDKAGTPLAYYALGDSGCEPWLFSSNPNDFSLEDTLKVPAVNRDWEELQIKGDTFYIGNTGNNRNSSKDLSIIRFSKGDTAVEQIKYWYQDQTAFPPSKDSLWYDAEAFLIHNDSLWIFSKCRSAKKTLGKTSIIGKKSVLYVLPDQPGEHVAAPVRTFSLRSWIVGAAWSPDHQRFVLLSYGRLYFFRVGPHGLSDARAEGCLRFPRGAQSEAVSWMKEKEILVTNEEGKVFQILFRK